MKVKVPGLSHEREKQEPPFLKYPVIPQANEVIYLLSMSSVFK